MFNKPLNLAANLVVAGQAYQPSRLEQRGYALLTLLALSTTAARAQSAEAALTQVKEKIIGIVQVIFVIVLVIGLIRVVMKFLQGAPDALGALGWLVGGVLLWFGFQLFKDDLVSAVGGSSGGGISN